MKTLIVGFGHRARHGKDTLAQMVHELMPAETKIYKFADALKAHCRVMGWMTKKDGPLLQYIGTDLYRAKNPNIWVDTLNYQIEEEAPQVALVTDMRFPNEKEWVESQGFSVRVERLNDNGTLYVATDRDPNHFSEIALVDEFFDFSYQIKSGDITTMRQTAMLLEQAIRENLRSLQNA